MPHDCASGGMQQGKPDALKKLKPDPRLDNLSDLLQAAALSDSKELIDYCFISGRSRMTSRMAGLRIGSLPMASAVGRPQHIHLEATLRPSTHWREASPESNGYWKQARNGDRVIRMME